MAVTIRDVAAEAGISFQLAAAVLGEKKYAHASEATRKKIMEASRKLGYVPNASARILRGDPSKIIGVLIDSRAPEATYSVLAEIEHLADALGYRILSAKAHDNPEKILKSYETLKQYGVDGIISFAHDYPSQNCRLDQLLKDDPKIVYLRSSLEAGVSAVNVDTVGGMKTALEHLKRNGYRNPALVLANELALSCRQRLSGFRRFAPSGCKSYFLSADEISVDALSEKCRKLIREKILPDHVDAIIAQNDNLAAILMKELLSEGIRIPQDFGLIGFDNLMIGQCLPVTLSTLYYDRKELADSIFKILLDKISGNIEPVQINCQMIFIPRESTNKKSI